MITCRRVWSSLWCTNRGFNLEVAFLTVVNSNTSMTLRPSSVGKVGCQWMSLFGEFSAEWVRNMQMSRVAKICILQYWNDPDIKGFWCCVDICDWSEYIYISCFFFWSWNWMRRASLKLSLFVFFERWLSSSDRIRHIKYMVFLLVVGLHICLFFSIWVYRHVVICLPLTLYDRNSCQKMYMEILRKYCMSRDAFEIKVCVLCF